MKKLSHENYQSVTQPHFAIITFHNARTYSGYDDYYPTVEYIVYEVYELSEREEWQKRISELSISKEKFMPISIDKIYKPKMSITID